MALQFIYSHEDFLTDVQRSNDKTTKTSAPFDAVIQDGWTERMEKGLFRYKLNDLQTHILPGNYGYVAQLNIQRGIERRKPQEILSIQQEFNHKQFNFNKINPDEIICEMTKCENSRDGLNDTTTRKMIVLVNVSPLEFGHCLFVPDPLQCYPQVLTKFAIEIGIESVFLSSDPGFRVGFNSLGGFASVNHLHLHGYYLDHELALESISIETLLPEKHFHRLINYHAGFVFYTEVKSIDKVAENICRVTDFLVNHNIAHNVFLTRGCPPHNDKLSEMENSSRKGVRIFVWPRKSCFGAKEESALNVALCELAGHLPFKNKMDFEKATEEGVTEIINKYLLPKDEFVTLEQHLIEHLSKS
ncbi:LOW QUALITY PROTEIN: GDP-D-glucose phosphorylase 1 [Boleophthalmus pectinirostris]|uniref:LOW QUALITY PROTEIN: GDP-D-glucose phosphorylase 1 n=1 Tax=Boleophthalmus pectinirostris TaxID=150288 RepID=UPI000A1C70E9|nr:LOW QUALITY PROTEIN: GDP-D-glucose phosphorylase 1 [Boleophthalmus pectinirostris]